MDHWGPQDPEILDTVPSDTKQRENCQRLNPITPFLHKNSIPFMYFISTLRPNKSEQTDFCSVTVPIPTQWFWRCLKNFMIKMASQAWKGDLCTSTARENHHPSLHIYTGDMIWGERTSRTTSSFLPWAVPNTLFVLMDIKVCIRWDSHCSHCCKWHWWGWDRRARCYMQGVHPRGASESSHQLGCNTCIIMSPQNYLEGSMEYRYWSNIQLPRWVWGFDLHSSGITSWFLLFS